MTDLVQDHYKCILEDSRLVLKMMEYISTDLVYISSGRHACKIGEAHIKG